MYSVDYGLVERACYQDVCDGLASWQGLMALLSSVVMEEVSPPLTHLGYQGPFAENGDKVRRRHTET